FCERYPEVQLELSVEDRVIDLYREGIDIAVRSGAPSDLSLVTRKICEVERVVCASPEYLARHGAPRSPEELRKHNCITLAGTQALRQWKFDTPSGRQVVEVAGTIVLNN